MKPGSVTSRPLPMPPRPPEAMPPSILKESSRDDAESSFSKFNDKPRVAFSEPSPPAVSMETKQETSDIPIKKKANLTIRPEEETRVVLALQKAAKKQATGSLFSVVVDISKNGTLDIGVKDLPENLLVVSLLKRGNGVPGAAEEAGIRLGDVIFGINFIPTREGSKTLITVIKLETEKKKRFLHIQAWRCHQLCSDDIPGYLFPRADDMFVRGYDLYQNKVFSDWERWNFIEIILGYMVEDLHLRAQNSESSDGKDETKLVSFAATGRVRARQMQALDLEKNILQAKGLRTAISVRIVHTKTKDDVVTYILRVEDVESGLVWIVTRRYNEFYALYEELNELSHFLRDLDFPRKRLTLRLSAKVIEQRVTMLEQYLRRALHILTLNASVDSSASHALQRVQHFLSIEKHVDCVHPPIVDDQRAIELMAYRFLNDFNSPACQQCVRFTSSVELEGMMESGEEGYRALLTFMHDALAEVEQFVQQQHEQQLVATIRSRRPEWTEEQQLKLVRQCIRRQVEAALYLPLRRPLVRILLGALDSKVKQLQRSVSVLLMAKPSVFMIDPMVTKTKSFPKAIKAFRRALLAHLPADQGQFLVEAAMAISEVHTECKEMARTSRRMSLSPLAGARNGKNTFPETQAFQPSDLRTLGTIRDDVRMVSIDDPTWAYDSEDTRGRSSFGRGHSSNRPAMSSSRRSLTERVSHFLMAESSQTGGRSSTGGGQDRRSSLTGGQGTHEGHAIDDDELDMGLGEETQRVSFSVGAATTAMMMLNIQTNDDGNSPTGNNLLSASAQKISSYVPRREQTTNMLEKRALSNEQQQANVLNAKRLLFANPTDNGTDNDNNDNTNDAPSETSEQNSSDTSSASGGAVKEAAQATVEAEDPSSSSAGEALEELAGVSATTTEANSVALSPAPAEASTTSLPSFPSSPSRGQPTKSVSRTSSSGALFDSDDDVVDPLSSRSTSVTGSGKDISIKTDSSAGEFSSATATAAAAAPITPPRPRGSVSFATDNTSTAANGGNNNNAAGNRLSTRQLDRTSSRKADIVDPLLRPPDEGPQRRGGSNTVGSAVVDSTIFAEVFDRYRSTYDPLGDDVDESEDEGGVNAISADDFLPIFTFVVVHVQVPQLLLLKELMVALIANEDAFGECGYYLATFEAALQHVNDLASQYDDVTQQTGVTDRHASTSVSGS